MLGRSHAVCSSCRPRSRQKGEWTEEVQHSELSPHRRQRRRRHYALQPTFSFLTHALVLILILLRFAKVNVSCTESGRSAALAYDDSVELNQGDDGVTTPTRHAYARKASQRSRKEEVEHHSPCPDAHTERSDLQLDPLIVTRGRRVRN
jgi:hypothetical protein